VSPARPLLTLLTDFGAGSGYPAQLKAVLLSALPDAQLVDVSHEVTGYDVLAGALLLEACAPRFPAHAVHLAVVDPGVGTDRRAVALADAMGRRFVGPDNGLFTPFLDGARVRELRPGEGPVPRPASSTFHGRDLFAPVAAFLAGGGDLAALGPEVADPVRLPWPRAVRRGDEIHGECLVADAFGNVVTSIRDTDLAPLPASLGEAAGTHGVEREARGGEPRAQREIVPSPSAGERGRERRGAPCVEVAGARARFVVTYGEGRSGELLALIGSSGRLELAVREGSAAARLGAFRGAPVQVRVR
jgi:S-adenosylmethionine hydrolase